MEGGGGAGGGDFNKQGLGTFFHKHVFFIHFNVGFTYSDAYMKYSSTNIIQCFKNRWHMIIRKTK